MQCELQVTLCIVPLKMPTLMLHFNLRCTRQKLHVLVTSYENVESDDNESDNDDDKDDKALDPNQQLPSDENVPDVDNIPSEDEFDMGSNFESQFLMKLLQEQC